MKNNRGVVLHYVHLDGTVQGSNGFSLGGVDMMLCTVLGFQKVQIDEYRNIADCCERIGKLYYHTLPHVDGRQVFWHYDPYLLMVEVNNHLNK